MIQDIFPSFMDIAFTEATPADNSIIMAFKEGDILSCFDGQDIVFPRYREIDCKPEYLFRVDDEDFFICFEPEEVPEGYEYMSMLDMRRLKTGSTKKLFEAFTAYHLYTWYETSKFCGRCGAETLYDKKERAKICPHCGNKIYPRINPAVIIGIRNGDRILITKYRRGYAHSALVAGFTEIGETFEDTVRREVMEEVGLKVKNITYYKSQPWGVAADILAGFYCDVDGDDTIRMDKDELKYAQWVEREEIELQPNDISLTNEMMKMFKCGRM
jgi:NAD+ diphosphatase